MKYTIIPELEEELFGTLRILLQWLKPILMLKAERSKLLKICKVALKEKLSLKLINKDLL